MINEKMAKVQHPTLKLGACLEEVVIRTKIKVRLLIVIKRVYLGSGSGAETSSLDKKVCRKPPSPKVDLKAANNAEVESVSASPRDESDMKILSLIKR